MAKSFLAGKLPLAVRGGYDFVDVRDVANGLLACSESGELGKGYILSGHYVTIRKMLQLVGKTAKLKYRPICLPLGLAKLAAPYYERRSLKDRKPLFYTPYSVSVLASNGRFSHAVASERFTRLISTRWRSLYISARSSVTVTSCPAYTSSTVCGSV